jgi:hypothetical protein
MNCVVFGVLYDVVKQEYENSHGLVQLFNCV